VHNAYEKSASLDTEESTQERWFENPASDAKEQSKPRFEERQVRYVSEQKSSISSEDGKVKGSSEQQWILSNRPPRTGSKPNVND
jgi:hypothetical protein